MSRILITEFVFFCAFRGKIVFLELKSSEIPRSITIQMGDDMKKELLFKDECYAIQGAIFEVYKETGNGFLEAVYQECLEKEFELRRIPYVSQKALGLTYKGYSLQQRYQADLVCFDTILLEIKAVKRLLDQHRAQIINYLKASGLRLGLLVNFGAYPKATIERFVV